MNRVHPAWRLTGHLLAGGALLCLLAARPAFAQVPDFDNPGPLQSLGGGGRTAVAALPQHSVKAPAGLPGAAANSGVVAPAQKSPQDMDPTAALFDAINRGDLAAARDAINRGADLNGHNLLGMTPIDLSIDLSRNPITFMLLSYNAADTGSSAPPPPAAAKRPGRAPRVAAAKPVHAAPVRSPVVHPAPMPTYAEVGGGTPAPSAGFLGFGQH